MVFIPMALALLAAGSGISSLQASEAATHGPGDAAIQTGELYLPSDNAMADVNMAMATARENDKLVLIIMGANWCHDSRALAARLFEAPLSHVIEDNYVVVFVDVGFFESGRDVITSLGSPVYYATPTVLIADADSGQVINADNRHQWANAASIGMQASVDYFQQIADKPAAAPVPEAPANLQILFSEIDAFEQTQADRLYAAYDVLGPMLRAYKSGDQEAFSETYWNAVRDFRYKVPKDVQALRTEAIERAAAGEPDIRLNYPQYPAFPWEK
jgi:hypothetical protein